MESVSFDRDRLRDVCQRYGIARLDVFGSTARAEDTPQSDIDLLYVLAPDIHLGFEFFDIEVELSEIFGRPVDLVSRDHLHPALRERVFDEAWELYAA
ncbi:MAG: nucleotidyltransferase family protein [Aeromicrobium sp.]|uniref:nucleotidyltransferase family protein n=1 Tax=Aeromicrobium sp. TaxID=1871063 RepID=UPI0039E5873A